MNVSPDFSLPIRTVAPYFIGGIVFNILAMLSLTGGEASMALNDYRVLGWVHLYLIGFVMMSIIGAMGQMSVVVGEVYHAYPDLFRWIFPLLGIGTAMLSAGFYGNPQWMMVGGALLLGALGLFGTNLFFTLRRSRRRTAIIRSMQWSTFFLGIGLLIGLAMASGYAGMSTLEASGFRNAHVFALIGGYVMINIMGVSTVLLPMFGACDRPADNDYTIGFAMMSAAVGMMVVSLWIPWLSIVSFVVAMGSVIYYMIRVYRVFTSKKRPYSDIWERSVAVAFVSLLAAVVCGMYGVVYESEQGIKIAFWLFASGFLGFLISAHLYKIVPFLVWFERFAPLIEERAVPPMHELLPKRLAALQWATAIIGVSATAIALMMENTILMRSGVTVMAVSGVLLLTVIVNILRFKGETA